MDQFRFDLKITVVIKRLKRSGLSIHPCLTPQRYEKVLILFIPSLIAQVPLK